MEGCQNSKNNIGLKSIKFDLENLVCEGSYDDLQSILLDFSGIKDVDIDKKLKAVFIDFEPEKITQQDITKIITECGCKLD